MLIHEALTGEILGAAFEVHGILGPGFLESVYEEALAYELQARGFEVDRQVRIPIKYKRIKAGEHVLDLIVERKVIVELKAISALADIHVAITLSYLKATNLQVAMLLNFGQMGLEHKRVVGRP
ncbi:MAG TPA: GxxExxY protein, partial [Candidatus Sulfotelmatobacter sp.]|nr:GxxExxY protein [Candidatus Sulfotelmatobacter sp.]